MNKLILIGNLGKDAECKATSNGKMTAKCTIAVKRKFGKDANGNLKSDWFNLEAWEKTAEFMGNYCKKGDRVMIEGRMETDSYTDQNGQDKTYQVVRVESVELLGGKKPEPNTQQGDDGIPF